MVDDPINRRQRRHGVFEDLVPLREGQVARDHHALALVALGEEREQHLHLLPALLRVFIAFQNQSGWFYDPLYQAYLRYVDTSEYGQAGVLYPDTDRLTERQIFFENVIVMFAQHEVVSPTNLDIHLDPGRSGKALLFRDGQVYKITWSTRQQQDKATAGVRPLRFLWRDGGLAPLKPGHTWIIVVTPETTVVAADIASFLFSALMLAFMVVPKMTVEHAHTTARQAGSQWVHVWSDWVAGLQLLKKDRLLLALFVVFGVMTTGDSMITALVVPFVKQVMRGDALLFGWALTAQAAGALVGGVAIGRLGRNWAPTRLIAVSLLVIGLLTVITFNLPYIAVVMSTLFLIGLFVPAAFVTAETLLQSNTRDEYRGRIFGTLGTTLALASLIGMVLAGFWGDSLGTVNVLNLASAVYISSGLIALVMLRQPSPKPAPGVVAAE